MNNIWNSETMKILSPQEKMLYLYLLSNVDENNEWNHNYDELVLATGYDIKTLSNSLSSLRRKEVIISGMERFERGLFFKVLTNDKI